MPLTSEKGLTSKLRELDRDGVAKGRVSGCAPDWADEQEPVHDNASRAYTYAILSGPLPVANYHSTISVSADPRGLAVKWVGKYEARGAPDADAKKVIDGIYEAGEKALVGG